MHHQKPGWGVMPPLFKSVLMFALAASERTQVQCRKGARYLSDKMLAVQDLHTRTVNVSIWVESVHLPQGGGGRGKASAASGSEHSDPSAA